MHEMSICEGIIQILEEQAVSQDYEHVKAVWLEIGPLAMIEPSALLFCFDAVAVGTIAEAAKLEIVLIPGEAWCSECKLSVAIKKRYDACPECGSYQLRVIQGDEMRIKEIEVE